MFHFPKKAIKCEISFSTICLGRPTTHWRTPVDPWTPDWKPQCLIINNPPTFPSDEKLPQHSRASFWVTNKVLSTNFLSFQLNSFNFHKIKTSHYHKIYLHMRNNKCHNNSSTHLWQKLGHRRPCKAITQPGLTLCVLSLQPEESKTDTEKEESAAEEALKGQKERQRESKLLLLCFIRGEGRLQTPRSSTKYKITKQSLTWAAQIRQELLLLMDALRFKYSGAGGESARGHVTDWSVRWDCLIDSVDQGRRDTHCCCLPWPCQQTKKFIFDRT